jgi:hypothetical protein
MTRCSIICVAAWCLATASHAAAQMATAERLEASGWWPTKPVSREGHTGPQACAACHPRQAAAQSTTSMARTGRRAADSEILRAHQALTFRDGGYSYSVTTTGKASVYSVTEGTHSRSAPLAWAFGAGKVGQSFLFERDGTLHEARISYYDAIGALDFTPNRRLATPRDIDDAMSRPVADAETRRCFACHTTASAKPSGGVDFEALIPGVTCEACHGPGRPHVTAMAQGRTKEAPSTGLTAGRAAIVNPRSLSAVDSVDFCGACHATFWDVKLADERGIAALRSQPYRLQSSRCWQQGDARLTCVACHDPHQPLVRDAGAYDARCLSCHVATGAAPSESHPGRACRTGTARCSSCHMPKYDVPGMHFKFTDHLIRVVRGP